MKKDDQNRSPDEIELPPARHAAIHAYIAGLALAASTCFALAFSHLPSTEPVKLACYLSAALLASSLKVRLPGIEGTFSISFLFTLIAIQEMRLPETLLIGAAGVLVQCYWRPAHKPKLIQLVFNLSQVGVCSAAAYGAYKLICTAHRPGPLALIAAATAHFILSTAAMSVIISLTETKQIWKVWTESYRWLFPYYLVAAAIVVLFGLLNRKIGWQSSLLLLLPTYLVHRSYRLYVGKLESERKQAEQVSKLHLRTIEALALAIEANDQTTGQHLQRVQFYAMELAAELGLGSDDTQALRAASVLHDIGKLAIPAHIISKPGRLTPEEFEKMKIHPIVGAEILERARFPYPVAAIVRAHHEKWDGSGYPNGLAREAIPIGARILSAVDCLDALASDRQYRKALPLHKAMAIVSSEAGAAFDPQVVEILQRHYMEWERLARLKPSQAPEPEPEIKADRGVAPAASFADLVAALTVASPATQRSS